MKKAFTLFFLIVTCHWAFAQLTVPVLSTPTNGSTLNALSTSLYWNSVSNINYYDYQYDTTANFSSPLLVSGTRSRSYRYVSISGLRLNTTYYWRVRTRSTSDTSAWSQVFSFTIPGISISGPADGAVASSPNVTINYSIPSGAYLYTDIDTVPTFNSPARNQGQNSTLSLSYFGKTYYWRARGYGNSEYTPWTETRTITLPASGPQLSSPTNNSVTVYESTQLSWIGDYYTSTAQVQYDTVATFDSPFLTQSSATNYLSIDNIPTGTRIYWRVRWYTTADTSDWSETWSFTRLGDVQAVSPNNGDMVSTLSPSLTFTGIDGYYVSYYVRCDTVPTFNSGALVTNSTTQYYTYSGSTYSCSVSNLHFGKTYYWQVRTIYDGDTSAWSNVATFQTPNTLTLSSPQDGSIQSQSCTLQWNSIYGINNYLYLVDTVSTFSSGILINSSTSNSYVSITVPALGRTYYWKVAACTANDTCWSETRTFSVNGQVTLSYPTDSTVLSGLETELSWNALGNSYTLVVDTVATLNSAGATTYSTSNNYQTINGLKFGKRYYWAVNGYSLGEMLPQSEIWSFMTPNSVVPYSPSNNSTVSYNYTYLYWNAISGVDNYRVEVDTVATFDSPFLQSSTTTSSQYYMSSLLYGQQYYWRVKAQSGTEETDWSQTMCFGSAGIIRLSSPADGSVVTANSSTYFSWNYNGNISYYQIQYDTIADFSSPLAQQSLQQVSNYYSYLSNFEVNKTYYWHVRALNPNNSSWMAWSETRSFSTPTSVTQSSPTNGSTLEAFNITLYCSTSNVDGWIYQVDTTPTFTSPDLRTGSGDYAYESNLRYSTTYYWRVAGIVGTDTMAWSNAWSFSTANGDLSLLSPVNGFTTNSVTQYFTWEKVTNCSGYWYQCDTVSTFDSPALITGVRYNSNRNFVTLNDLYYEKTHYWRVCSFVASDTSDWSDAWTFYTTQQPTLVSPASGTTLQEVNNTLTWNPISGSRTYQYQYDTTASFTSPAVRTSTTSSSSASISQLYYGKQYSWRVRAIDNRDTSSWSDAWTFNTPATITLSSPADSAQLTELSTYLQWNYCTGSSYYQYQMDTVPTFNSAALQSSSISYTSAYFSNLYYGTTYYWRVRGYHYNDTSAWSETRIFTTPATVTLVSPLDDAQYITSTTDLSWELISGSTSYQYQYDTVATFQSPIVYTGTRGSGYNSVSISNLRYNTDYYWRVRAINYNIPDTSDWSEVRHFQTFDNLSLLSPADGSVSTTISNTISWTSTTGSSYVYHIDTVATFDSPALQTGSTTSASKSFSNLYYGTTYYWRVAAYNNNDTSAWSDVWSFTTPTTILLNSPENDLVINTLSQTLSWYSCTGTSYYEYQYDTTAAFSSAALRSNTTYSTSVSLSNLYFETRMYWRVRGWNSVDTSDWSEVRYFNTDNAMTLNLPANDSALQIVNPRISWNSYAGCSAYQYQYDTTATFDSPLAYTGTTSYLYRNLSALQYGATYYWRVRAYHSLDSSAWSEVRSFTTPARIILSTPDSGTVVSNTLTQSFYWNLCSGTNTYQYQIDTVPTFNSPAVFVGTRSSSYSYVSLSNLFYESDIYWRVRGWHSADTSDWSETWSITTTGRMTLSAPSDSSDLTMVNQTLSWNSYPGSSSYQYQYDTTTNFNSAALVSGTTTSTSYSVSNLYFGTRYHWRVRAINSRDTSAWSDVWTFTTPAVVTLQSPEDENTIATVSQQLRWNSIGNSITYQLQYDTSATFTSPILVTYSTSNTYYTASNLCYGGHYYWRVRATNSVGTTDWSDVWEFTTESSVTLVSPLDSTVIPDITTTIRWNSYPGTSTYQYQFDTVPTFNSPLSSMISTSYTYATLSNLQYGKTYYWHVRAVNSGSASAWSETWTFSTPSQVTLSSPTNGDTSSTISNTLSWNSISGSSSYIYEIDTVNTFDSPVYQSNSTSSTSYSFSNLYYGKTYYWRVKAQNSNATADWSETWHFTTPARTTLSSPDDSTNIYSLSQTIYWNTLTGSTKYQYQCDTTLNFNSPALITGVRSSSYNYVSLSNLCFESTNYWRVRCINSVDTSDWSEVRRLNTIGQMLLKTPVDSSILTTVTQTLTWYSYTGASRYEYQYDTTLTFNSPVAYSATTTSTSASSSNLAYGAHYYWRARAINSRDTSAWSEVWSFFTPSTLELISPSDGYNSGTITNTLQWNALSGSSYIYELDTTQTFDSPLYYTSYTSATSVSVSALHYGKTYYWRVAAVNNTDTSVWSEVWSFTTPARTTLSTPSNHTTLTTLSRTFYWNTLNGTTRYEYQADTLADFSSAARISGTTTYNSVSISNLFFESTIYWRVRCINSVDTSDWTDTWDVTTTGQMTLQSPADSSALTTTSTYLYWNTYTGASYYQYQIDTTATFNSPFMQSGIVSGTNKYVSNLSYGKTYYWRVRATNTRDSSAWSDTWSFTVPSQLTLLSPADESTLAAVTYSFNWQGISGSSYIIQKDTVPTFNSPALTSSTTSSTSISLSNLYYGTTHYWRVAAYNSTDTTAWSDMWSFTTPARTTLSSPADGTAVSTSNQYFYWNTINGSTKYQYQFDTLADFSSAAAFTGIRSSSYDYVSLSNLFFESTIYWRVRCINSVDTSDWSNTWTVMTTGQMTLQSPADSSTLSATSTYLYWNSYSGASYYQYQLDTTATFNSPSTQSGITSSTSTYVSNLNYGVTYYWHVRAINSRDSSAWSDTWTFTVSDQLTLASPYDGAALSAVSTTLSWTGISGSSYIIQRDTVSTFNSPALTYGTTSSTSLSISNLYYGTTYYWRVAAYNNVDTTAWSEVWSFTTPAAVTLSSPADASTVYSNSQYLYWNAITGSSYRYQLDDNPYFNSANMQSGTTSSTSKYFSGLSYGVTYYWRIQAYNSVDNAEWSDTWSFTILSSTLPNAPILISPADGSVNIPTGSQNLVWNYLANANEYEVQYSPDSTFAGAGTFQTYSTTYTIGGLSPLTTYYWRVRGKYYNEYSPWSDVWHFTTVNCSVYAPTDIESACETFTWRGQTLTTSGVYRDTIFHTTECDSIYILSLTINHNVQNEITISAQGSYVWNGTTYTTSGDYVQTFTTVNGCDSTVTLHLTITTGITDQALLTGLQVYPNPTTGEFTVHISDSQLLSEIRIYDMVGHLVETKNVEGTDTKMDLSQVNPGMYILRFVQNGRIVGSSKVIITR